MAHLVWMMVSFLLDLIWYRCTVQVPCSFGFSPIFSQYNLVCLSLLSFMIYDSLLSYIVIIITLLIYIITTLIIIWLIMITLVSLSLLFIATIVMCRDVEMCCFTAIRRWNPRSPYDETPWPMAISRNMAQKCADPDLKDLIIWYHMQIIAYQICYHIA